MPHINTIFLIIFVEKVCFLSREKNVHFETEGASHEAAAQNYANSQYISKHGLDIYCWMNFITAL